MSLKEMNRYALSAGAFRIGLFFACVFLLIRLFVEPRPDPRFNFVADALLSMAGFAAFGYFTGLLIWLFRKKSRSGADGSV